MTFGNEECVQRSEPIALQDCCNITVPNLTITCMFTGFRKASLLMFQKSIFLCRYRKRTDIYYSTWSLENVSKSCQFQFFRPPPPKQTLTIFGGVSENFFRPPHEKLLVDISYNIPAPVNRYFV